MTVSTAQMRFWSPEVRELEPYVPGEQPKIQNLLKLNTNENPYPPSPKVVEAVQEVLHEQADVLRLYPDPDATVLKQAIAKQQNIDVSQVFVGNGSDEVLAHIFKAFFLQDGPILYPDITYSFYPVYSQFFGTKQKKFLSMRISKLMCEIIPSQMVGLLLPTQMHQQVLRSAWQKSNKYYRQIRTAWL